MSVEQHIREQLESGERIFFFADHGHSSPQVQRNFRQVLQEINAAIGDIPKILFIEENHTRKPKLYPDPTELLSRFKAREDLPAHKLEAIAGLEEAHHMGFGIIPIDWDKSELKKEWGEAYAERSSHLSPGELSDMFNNLWEQRMTGSNAFMASKITEELHALPPETVSIVWLGSAHLGRSAFRSAEGRYEWGVDQHLGGAIFDVTHDGVEFRGNMPKADIPPPRSHEI